MTAATPPLTPRAHDPFARPRKLILASLLMLTAVGWALVLWQSSDGGSMSGDAGGSSGLDLTMGMAAPLFLAMWVAMMIAMMVPSAAPMILLFDRIQRGKRNAGRSYVPTAYFVGAYLAIWAAFGCIAFGLALGIDRLAADAQWFDDEWARLGGALLIVAGLYQLTPLKEVCLNKCRTPMAFLLTSWRDGKAGAVRMGLLHGGYCLGCCWLLFVILLPLGVMNVAAMVVIALLVFGEKCLPAGNRVARASAFVLVAYGLLVMVSPGALPTTISHSGPMGGM